MLPWSASDRSMTTSTAQQTAIPCVLMRGGTSKAAFFDADDLPAEQLRRDAMILGAMGYPDARQIDGIGGGTPLTTKVAIVSRSQRVDSDIDYLFGQVVPAESRIDYAPTCGNILAAVGPYAIDQGWVRATGDETQVRIFMCNTESRCTSMVQTRDGAVNYAGDSQISGVPGTAAPIYLSFEDILGSTCGSLFPSGNHCDQCDGVSVTCIDHGMPVVIARASDFGLSGYESPAQLDADVELKRRIENVRLQAGLLMGLGDVGDKVIPKVTLVALAKQGGSISTRTFIPRKCHDAIGVLGAVSVATAMLYADAVTAGMAVPGAGSEIDLSIEHPTGDFGVRLFRNLASGELAGAALMRTARALFRGDVLLSPQIPTLGQG
jgi:4-oxalomesaconate tautomerase